MRVIRETAAAKGSQLFIPTEKPDNIFEQNKVVAIEALRILGVQLSELTAPLPLARFQTVCTDPLIIVDGAHNYDAIQAVLKMIPKNAVIVFGMLKSKDYDSCIKLLDGYKVVLVNDVESQNEIKTAMTQSRKSLKKDEMIFVCGSIYLAANVLKLLQS
jgi:folylpolyglutamate synthase/dihydropteroate synthase